MEKDIKEGFLRATERMRRVHMGNLMKDLTQGEFFILEMVERRQEEQGKDSGVIVSELVKGMRISAPAVSRMLRSLEEKELIMREVHSGDRRNTYVYLTGKGKQKKEEASARRNEFSERIGKKMGDQDVKELLRLLEKLTDILEEELLKTGKETEQ